MRHWWLWLCLLGWVLAVPSEVRAQSPQTRLEPWAEAIAGFLNAMKDPLEDEFRTKCRENRIEIGQVKDSLKGTRAETTVGKDHVTLDKTKILSEMFHENLQTGKSVLQPRAVMDWAGTWKHERVHTQQKKADWYISCWQDAAGQGNYVETEGWSAGFQAYRDWFKTTQEQLKGNPSLEEKRKLWQQLAELGEIFSNTQDSYRTDPDHRGWAPARVQDEDGIPVLVSEVLEEITKASTDAKRLLGEESLQVLIKPRTWTGEVGSWHEFNALVQGGFPGYRCRWTWNGAPVEETQTCKVSASAKGNSQICNLQIKKSGTLGIEVLDGNARKANSSVPVTVSLAVSLPARLQVRPDQDFQLVAKVLGGSGNYTYCWTRDGLPNQHVTAALPGKGKRDCQYAVEVRDQDGATGSAHCDIVVAPPLAVTLPGRVAVAPGDNFRVEAQAQGGRPPFTYRWRRDGTLIKLSSPVGEGKGERNMTLQVEVVDAVGQIASASCSVEVNAVVSALEVSVSPGSAAVEVGDKQDFAALVRGGRARYKYKWYKNQQLSPVTSRAITVNTDTPRSPTYTVVVTDADGKRAQATATLIVRAKPEKNPTIDPTGSWKNSRGSVWTITRTANGGYYATESGLGNAKGPAFFTSTRTFRINYTFNSDQGPIEGVYEVIFAADGRSAKGTAVSPCEWVR